MVDVLPPVGAYPKWEVNGTATEGYITISVMQSGSIFVKQEMKSGAKTLLKTLQAISNTVSVKEEPMDEDDPDSANHSTGKPSTATSSTETHSNLEDKRHPDDIQPKGPDKMFCSIRVKLQKSTERDSSDSPASGSPKPVPNEENGQSVTGDIELNSLEDCDVLSKKASLPTAEVKESNVHHLSDDSSSCAVATAPVEDSEQEEEGGGNVFQMFRSKNNNTLLDALCDSLIREGVTKKFASKNDDSSTNDNTQRRSVGTGTIPCPKCDSTFSKLRYLKDHIKRKHDVYECPVCGDKSFNSHVGVEKHMRRVHNMHGEYLKKAMNIRESSAEPLSNLKEDSLDASQDDSEACEGDGRSLEKEIDDVEGSMLQAPQTTEDYSQGQDHEDMCAENSPQQSRKRKIKGAGAIPCPQCPATFSAARNLKDHIKRKHLTFMCTICGDDSFVSQKGIDRHMGKAHPYALPIRNQTYVEQFSLVNVGVSSDSGSHADSAPEHSDASFQDVPAELSWGNFPKTPETKRKRKGKPFPVAMGSNTLLLNQANNEILQEEEWTAEPKRKKQRGTGTIPCPHCTSTFSEHRYLKDHLRRKHVKIECTVCGDSNFYSYKGLQRHMQTVHPDENVSQSVATQDDKSSTCSSEVVAQAEPAAVNGNLQAETIPNTSHNDTVEVKSAEVEAVGKDVNNTQGNKKGRKKAAAPVARNKRKSETRKPVEVEPEEEAQDESVADESEEGGDWQTVEPKKKRRKKKSRGTGTIPCPRCDSTFSKARYLRDHIKRKHDISVCPICGDKNFYSQRGVERHIRTVHGDQVEN